MQCEKENLPNLVEKCATFCSFPVRRGVCSEQENRQTADNHRQAGTSLRITGENKGKASHHAGGKYTG